MNRKLILLPLFCLMITLIFLSYPKSVFGEIATIRDWIGFFPLGAGDSKNATVNNNSWVYTSSCTQNLGTVPKLERNPTGCDFIFDPVPTDGSYQFRLYANNEETNEALIATSKVIYSGTGSAPSPTSPLIPGKIYQVSGNLILDNNITVDEIGIIFVDVNLSINTDLTHDNENAGLVFVVKGDIIIAPSVTRIDAVLISSGTIYTAGASCEINSFSASQLVINGSLISLDPLKPIRFCRTMLDNNQPAEKINQQPKYLVILRDLYSDTLQKWSEIE